MDDVLQQLEAVVPLQGLLGYLNFSAGKPDPRSQKQVNDAYAFLAERGAQEPWAQLRQVLGAKLTQLRESGGSAFQDVRQAESVLELTFERLLPAYRRHHADLLAHRSGADLYGPFFLARALEAVLSQGPPWNEEERIVGAALAQLNDFVGYRPVAVLETRPRGELYDHERVRPIPLFLRGAGVAWGRYRDLIERALRILQDLAEKDNGVLAEAQFDLELLDELALDPRAYDQTHPVNRRPNYNFGEWDPHHLDGQGHFRRFVLRHVTLDALLDRAERADDLPKNELLFEAAAVLAGTMLMASGSTGGSPTAYDSGTTLATLVPRIARYRDVFYAGLLEGIGGPHGDRLRQEAATTRQPFGGARQHLNQYMAQHRAAQVQQRHLALIFAQMGYPKASREEAARIPTTSVRLLSEIFARLTTAQRLIDQGRLADAARLFPEAEGLLHRGIACGALADPWNILGFQGLFPLSPAREDSLRDTRLDELTAVVEQSFHLAARLMSEAASVGEKALVESVGKDFRRLAAWWDQFASAEVGDVRGVRGAEALKSARNVAAALARWHERGAAAADLAFWRQHLDDIRSPKAFAFVSDALLRKKDYRAALALLVNWAGQADEVPLEDDESSFHGLALRWMLGVVGGEEVNRRDEAQAPSKEGWELARKFFDYLEANAEDAWRVPTLEAVVGSRPEPERDDQDNLYGAAYEGVVYRDSTGDDNEGAVMDGGPVGREFVLAEGAEGIARRLRFLSTVATLWQVAVRGSFEAAAERAEVVRQWLATARRWERELLDLLEALQRQPIPEPLGSEDALIEYDRRRELKERLVYSGINTCLDMSLAVGALRGALGESQPDSADRPPWDPPAVELEQALLQGDVRGVRAALGRFVGVFREEPLTFLALSAGGEPRHILRARLAQAILQALVVTLPRLGLLRETFHLLKTARLMETKQRPPGSSVTQFDDLFQAGFQSVVESAVDAAWDWEDVDDRELVGLLERLTLPFLKLWAEHCGTVRLSALERVRTEQDWQELREFIRRYGRDLFHARFMTLANLRGILHRGAGEYLDHLRDNPDPLHPIRLLDDLDRTVPHTRAVQLLHTILEVVAENYEAYRDYNTTTTQSDYGENLHLLLDFLRLKAGYERQGWHLKPMVLVHEVLAHEERDEAAKWWEQAFARGTTEVANRFLEELRRLETAHGMRLRSVSDRLQERFVKPLALDRLCALVEPAMEEAWSGEGHETFDHFRRELAGFTAAPTGSGLDVPPWIRRLEAEVERALKARTALATAAEHFLNVPRMLLTSADFLAQLEHWEEPLSAG